MATTYTAAKTALDNIAQRSTANEQRLAQARQLIAAAVSDLASMRTAYAAIVGDIDAAAAAAPADAAWAAMKAEKDKLVADFLALETRAQADQAALNGS